MGAQAPQWLLSAFVDAMQQIGATATTDELDVEAFDLAARWSTPDRHVHNLRHLINVLAHIDEIADTAHDPDVLRIAAWYHGAFLNKALEVKMHQTDTDFATARCVNHAYNRLTALGVSEEVVERVDELITYLVRHRAPRADFDAQVLMDADLAMLSVSPQEYKKFRENLRTELAELDDVTYLKARKAVVDKLLLREKIYSSPLGEEWEDATRANLEVEQTRLTESLSKLCAESADSDIDDDSEDEDDVDSRSDEDVTSTGTIIIKRRSLKATPSRTSDDDDPLTTTGVLPVLKPIDDKAASNEDETTSSLESAIDDLDIPAERD
ncbi:HD domain-containing protein [Schaalia vaccimaxillae]|uniref:HD domain-containing protein n=1 Tax=Schaalia vaccimaxillae TaxID=183916 RepID=UPI0003B7891C|nr:hypothetical protein [Schaalia vaccimaxillae]